MPAHDPQGRTRAQQDTHQAGAQHRHDHLEPQFSAEIDNGERHQGAGERHTQGSTKPAFKPGSERGADRGRCHGWVSNAKQGIDHKHVPRLTHETQADQSAADRQRAQTHDRCPAASVDQPADPHGARQAGDPKTRMALETRPVDQPRVRVSASI